MLRFFGNWNNIFPKTQEEKLKNQGKNSMSRRTCPPTLPRDISVLEFLLTLPSDIKKKPAISMLNEAIVTVSKHAFSTIFFCSICSRMLSNDIRFIGNARFRGSI